MSLSLVEEVNPDGTLPNILLLPIFVLTFKLEPKLAVDDVAIISISSKPRSNCPRIQKESVLPMSWFKDDAYVIP